MYLKNRTELLIFAERHNYSTKHAAEEWQVKLQICLRTEDRPAHSLYDPDFLQVYEASCASKGLIYRIPLFLYWKLLDKKEPLIDFLLLPTSIITSVKWTAVADKEAFGHGLRP